MAYGGRDVILGYRKEILTKVKGMFVNIVNDGENKYLDFDYGYIETIMGLFGKTNDDLEGWLNVRDVEIIPNDQEIVDWLVG